MSFVCNCPFCHQELTCEDAWAGMQSQCPVCGKTITLNPPAPIFPATAAPNTGDTASQAPQNAAHTSIGIILAIYILTPLVHSIVLVITAALMAFFWKPEGDDAKLLYYTLHFILPAIITALCSFVVSNMNKRLSKHLIIAWALSGFFAGFITIHMLV